MHILSPGFELKVFENRNETLQKMTPFNIYFMFFAFLSIAASNSINSKDAEKLFTEEKHTPIFVILYSRWCPHCHEFIPIKQQLESYYKESKEVDIL